MLTAIHFWSSVLSSGVRHYENSLSIFSMNTVSCEQWHGPVIFRTLWNGPNSHFSLRHQNGKTFLQNISFYLNHK